MPVRYAGNDNRITYGRTPIKSLMQGETAVYGEDLVAQQLDKIFVFDDSSNTASVTGLTEYGKTLQSIQIPSIYRGKAVTNIGDRAFNNATNITSVTIPDSVTSIGGRAFAGCDSLTSVTIGNSVTSIGGLAFNGCYKLVEVYNKSSLDITAGSSDYGYVGYYAKHVYTEEGGSWLSDTEDGFRFFWDGETGYLVAYLGSETELTLPDSFTAYDGTEMTSYQIYDYAFYGRGDLTAVTIADSVTSIGDYAFRDCYSLISVTIADSVTSIGDYAFAYCPSLERLTVASGNPVYHSAGNCIIETASKTLIAGCKASVIPTDGSVTTIGERAFYGCTALASVTIPDSVTSIGRYAFYGCTAEIIWGGTPAITEIGGYAFAGYDGTSIAIADSVTSIGQYAFEYCTALESITIPFVGATKDGTSNTHFGYIFGASDYGHNDNDVPTSLKEVIITGGASIGDHAFAYCYSLTSVTIPDSVTRIRSYAFSDCTSLTSVTFGGTTRQWNAIIKGSGWKSDCPFSVVVCSDGTVRVL